MDIGCELGAMKTAVQPRINWAVARCSPKTSEIAIFCRPGDWGFPFKIPALSVYWSLRFVNSKATIAGAHSLKRSRGVKGVKRRELTSALRCTVGRKMK